MDAYPMRFCNIIEKIFSDDIQGTFGFNIQDKNVAHVIVNLSPTESWSLPNWVVLEHKTTVFLDKIKEIKDLQRKRDFNELSEEEQKKLLTSRLCSYISEKEKEKLEEALE